MESSKVAAKSDQHLNITPLDKEARTVLPTAEAAVHLNRAAQTLRIWACKENGPIRPVRINGRLGWRVSDLLQLVEG